ncbi:MAG: serine/threonine-protein kinase [Planctomycetaceae bacterium]
MSAGETTVDHVDEYQLINCIATGTHSQIWEVAESGGEHFAMKLLLPDAFRDPAQRRVLKHEARIAKMLRHPGLIRFHKVVVDKHHAYFIMDHFRAPNLKQQIQSDLPAVQLRFRKIVESTCLALQHMHDLGWAHRDVKPDNILLNRNSEIRLIDFSLALRIASGLGKLLAGKSKVIQGTRTYIAPETIKRESSTARTDMYSLGVTFFEILTGRPPFLANSPNDLLRKHLGEAPPAPSHVNPNVTPEADRAVLRMLEKKPDKRFRDLNEVFSEFRNIQPFKQEVESKVMRQAAEDAREQEAASLGVRISSRGDAFRTQQQQDDVEAVPEAAPPIEPPPARDANSRTPERPRPRPRPASVPVPPAPDHDDLPFMDELPEIN